MTTRTADEHISCAKIILTMAMNEKDPSGKITACRDITLSRLGAEEIDGALTQAKTEIEYWRNQAAQMASVIIADGELETGRRSTSKSSITRRLHIARAIVSSLSRNGWIGHLTGSMSNVKKQAETHLKEVESIHKEK